MGKKNLPIKYTLPMLETIRQMASDGMQKKLIAKSIGVNQTTFINHVGGGNHYAKDAYQLGVNDYNKKWVQCRSCGDEFRSPDDKRYLETHGICFSCFEEK